MASTNKTTNYDLSQYIGTDKPTYLSDYNGDMYKIDAQMKVNADNVATAISSASTATSTANTANSTANSALSTAQSASSTATSASTTATNAQTTANSALSTATTAQTKVNEVETNLNNFEQLFNFVNFDNLTLTTNSGEIYDQNIKCASNSDGSIGKLYGRARIRNITAIPPTKLTLTANTRLRPTSNITISCLGISSKGTGGLSSATVSSPVDVLVKTNGDIEITTDCRDNWEEVFLFPSMLFMKDFGDTPTPPEN